MLNRQKISTIDYTFNYHMMKDSDKVLFDKIKDSDKKSFELLFREYYERLCHYANAMLHDMPNAEDEVQLMFTKLWDKRHSLYIETTVKSYLYQSVKNGCLNRIKQLQVHHHHQAQYTSQYKDKTSSSNAQNTTMTNEVNDLLYKAIEEMPSQCKVIFEMSRMEGLKHQEIADKLGLNIKTIENQIGRALKIVKVHLRDYLTLFFFFLLLLINQQ
jgi:RNA polymerase sigma-70 factor (family 1)